ncbi:hypothetical protein [Frankia sp. Cas4]|uniref:hypothetical protein n=1 Tax=Frankia sp. Cas4 TaxID=3073927 RepID=UPI002AD323A7|nr:hypothetical protein [Frankia sp. Cas4]
MTTAPSTNTVAETVLPRPVEQLPTPALAAATRKLTDRLTDLFNMGDEAAQAFALAVVDPSVVRRVVENPERLPVPGGAILAVRAEVWARCIIPDPRNPRIGPARRHPASSLVGREESTRFRPLSEPTAAPDDRPELLQRLQNQEHLAWVAKQAHDYVIDNNDWRESIRQQGVMTEVWLAATTFVHDDGTPNITVPVTAEGSSRMTCVHDLLGLRSADVPYGRDERKLRSIIRKLNEEVAAAGTPDEVDLDVAVRVRCEKVPALLLVGFESHRGAGDDFGVAVKSLVALRHVDYPKPWGEATENEALADAVIDELERRGLITAGRAEWLMGALTPDEAEAAGFNRDPAIRAATIVRHFTDRGPQVHAAIRVAITSQSTRKRITTKLLLDVATSLILRSLPEEDARKRERTRKYLKEALSVELAKEWDATLRSAEELAAAAYSEAATQTPGPATRELAARSAYPLVVAGALTADRGTRNSDQPDRRHPGEVIDRMRATVHGVHQLRQALVDVANGRRIRLVDDAGEVIRNDAGRDVIATDAALRNTFPRAGEGPMHVPAPTTPAEILGNALNVLGNAIQVVEDAVKKVEAVQSEDGMPAIDSLGADKGDCEIWRGILLDTLEKLPLWKQRGLQRHGPGNDIGDIEDDLDQDDLDDDFDEDDVDGEGYVSSTGSV